MMETKELRIVRRGSAFLSHGFTDGPRQRPPERKSRRIPFGTRLGHVLNERDQTTAFPKLSPYGGMLPTCQKWHRVP